MKTLFLSLGLFLMIPNLSLAVGVTTDMQQKQVKMVHKDFHDGHHRMNDQQWQAKMKERESELLSLVSQYSPEKKQEWEKVIAEGKTLRTQWLSPEFSAKREQWKKEKIAKMQALKKAYEDGKITKDEFFAKIHGGQKMGNWKTYHDLKTAVANKNEQQIKSLLDQMLSQAKMRNEKMKIMIQASRN